MIHSVSSGFPGWPDQRRNSQFSGAPATSAGGTMIPNYPSNPSSSGTMYSSSVGMPINSIGSPGLSSQGPGPMPIPQVAGKSGSMWSHGRSGSFSSGSWSDAQQGMHPSWDIWAPVATGSASSFNLSPSSAGSGFSAVGQTSSPPLAPHTSVPALSPSSSNRLWFSPGQHGLSSPPLTPQTSPSLVQTNPALAVGSQVKKGQTIWDSNRRYSQSQEPAPMSLAQPVAPRVMPPRGLSVEDSAAFETLVLSLSSAGTSFYFVAFKAGRLDVFTASDKTVFPISVGDLVIVDADRGRDLGKIVADQVSLEEAAMLKWEQHEEQRQILHQCASSKDMSMPLGTCTPKQILRAAQASEIQPLATKTAAEAKAVAQCNQKARERELDMIVVDAEYQWDRRKLTFFYKANQRVDFRDLVRDLFRTYKTRIWMCAVADSVA